ncbi:MAG: S24 family peptidase [Huintestinicola sp.]
MKVATTSERIKQILSERNIRQIDIIDAAKPYSDKYNVKLNKNDLSQYVSGKTEPGQRKLSILGMALNVNEAWLMGYDVPMERTSSENLTEEYPQLQPLPEMHKIPLIGAIACGKPIYREEDEWISTPTDINADFCLRCEGDSMINARIHDGDIVFIKECPMVDNGQIAAVSIDNEVTLKRVYYYPEKNKLVLSPENPAYEPFVYTNEELNDIRILGKAVKFLSNVR